jgi:DNA integrity scanning protein DisA with diadenylate cyclase activity
MKMQAQLESAASTTTPATLTVGVTVLLGFTLNEWVLITALIAGILQAIIFMPRAIRALIEIKNEMKKLFKGEDNGCEHGHTEQDARACREPSNRKTGVRGSKPTGSSSSTKDA